jgi:hypothetical protein
LAVSALALWLTGRTVSVADLVKVLGSAHFLKLGPYLALFVLIQVARALRWRLLLDPVARPPFRRVNEASAVGLMVMTLLPLRIGEIARPMLIASPPELTTARALPSIVIEHIVDAVATGLILLMALLLQPDHLRLQVALKTTGIAILLVSVLALSWLLLFPGRGTWIAFWVGKAAGCLKPEWGSRARHWAGSWVGAIQLPGNATSRALLVLVTCAYWAFAVWSLQVLGGAVGLAISMPMACTVTGAINLGAVVPAGPGMAGTLQVSTILAFSLVAPQASLETRIAAFAHLLWATQLLLQVAWGLLFLPSLSVRRRLASLMLGLFGQNGKPG